MKKIIFLSIMCVMLAFNFTFATEKNADETKITFSKNEILIDGNNVTKDITQDIYLQTAVETHDDVAEINKNIENKVITITKAGTYRITGTIDDTQIRVQTTDKSDVILILDNANITCKTAPAILIKEAYDAKVAGEANVKLILENKNTINGSHVAEYYDKAGNKIKHDAAISSIPSLLIEGEGGLLVNSDNEGIESKMHLTINGGTIEIFSEDDALNASEDGVSYITINDGSIYAIVGGDGGEGDGLDSNGYIAINGGFVVAQAHSTSQDTGLDADLGITINGGTVIATGNMYEGIDESSKQQFMQMYFEKSQNSENVIVITKADGTPVIAFKPINSFSILECSSPAFENGTYYSYVGGKVEGTERDGVYTEITSYEKGTQLSHTGTMSNNMRPGNMGGDMFRGNIFDVENLDFSGITLPDDVTEEQIKDILKQLIENNFDTNRENIQNGGFKPEDINMMTPPNSFGEREQMTEKENFNNQMSSVENSNNKNQMLPPGNMTDVNQNTNFQNRSYEFVLSETEHEYRGVATIEVNAENNVTQNNGDINNDYIQELETYNSNLSIIIICLIIVVVAAITVLLMRGSRK